MKKILLTLTAGAFLSVAVAQDITSNLVAYVSFDNGDAGIDDGTATIVGNINGATPADDRNGNPNSAMYFDGNDWIDFGNELAYQFGYDSFTITCWMKAAPSGNGTGYVFGKRAFVGANDQAYALTHNYTNGGQVFGYLRGDNYIGGNYPTASVLVGEWHHVALIVDRGFGGAAFYIDGAPIGSSGVQLNPALSTFNCNGTTFGNVVMGRSSNGDQYFKGWVDELRVYRRALTSLDLSALQDPETIDLTSNLRIDLPFCDGQVVDETTLHDMSTQFDGTYATLDRNGTTDAARAFSTGSQSFMQLPHDLIFSTDFSISLWYYYAGVSGSPRLMDLSKQLNSVSDAIILYPSVSGGNVPYFGMWNSSGVQEVSMYAGNTTSINEWTHLVVTKIGSLYSIYMNGQLATASTNPFVPANVNRIVSNLGKSAYSSTPELFLGSIDDFKVWQRGLSANEVDALYNDTDPCIPVVPCDVYIPDANLKTALTNNSSINTNFDGEIQCSEASAYTGYIGLNDPSITDLTGLEAFTSAYGLDISLTGATSFDITANTSLTYFNCGFLALSGTLTFDAANAALEELFVNGNQLSGLDVSALPNLQHLNCASNNNLTSLNVSANPELRILAADYNNLSALNLSNNLQLTDLSCASNAIVALDVSGNPDLVTINVQGNVAMTYLNVANGNNTNFTYYNSFNNPNLGCIQVDDVAYSVTNWTNVHPFSTFNTFCTPPITVGLDEQESATLSIYPNPTESLLFFSEAIAGEVSDLSGKSLIQFPTTRTLDLSRLADGVYLIRTVSGTVNRIVKN